MKFLKEVNGVTFRDQQRNGRIRKEVNIFALSEGNENFRTKWKKQMENCRYRKLAFHYKSPLYLRIRSLGRPMKR